MKPVHTAARDGDAAKLHGLRENLKDANGWTPLHHAALAGRVDAAQAILQLKGSVNGVDRDGYTPTPGGSVWTRGRRVGAVGCGGRCQRGEP
jgi:hypothetical protein